MKTFDAWIRPGGGAKVFWYQNVPLGRPGRRWFDTRKLFSVASKVRLLGIKDKKKPPRNSPKLPEGQPYQGSRLNNTNLFE